MIDQKYFASVDEFGLVQRVILAPSQEWVDANMDGDWFECDKPENINYPGIGWYYDISIGKFIPPIPFNSWILDEDGYWQPPIPRPEDDNIYDWNEDSQQWVLREIVITEANPID